MPGHWKQLIETIVLYDRSLLIALQIRRMIKKISSNLQSICMCQGRGEFIPEIMWDNESKRVYVLQKPWNLDLFESVLY